MFSQLQPFRDEPYNLQFLNAGELLKWTLDDTLIVGIKNYEIITPTNKDLHIINRTIFTSSTNTVFSLIENGITADGVASAGNTPYNLNRITPSSGLTTFKNSPTTGGAGTNKIATSALIANNIVEMLAPELVLPRNSKYLITFLTGAGGAAKSIFMSLTYYEATN